MADIKTNILEAVGNTPMVRLNKVTNTGTAEVLVKCEYLNPSGSLKDRVAKYMIDFAEKEGRLKPGWTIVEASTGNMGSALAMASAVKGYRFICCMPEEMTEERSKIMRMFGGEVRYTGPIVRSEEIRYVHREVAQEIEASNANTWWSRQFSNMANVIAHEETTGREIIEQTDGAIDAFVMSIGSAGTLMGVARALKKQLPDRKVKIVAVEPEQSPILSKGKAGYHKIPGISDGFVPEILETEMYDEVVLVSDKDAIEMAHRLRREEGLFCGISSGANVVAAAKVAKQLGIGKTVITILPDSADRYFSFEAYVK